MKKIIGIILLAVLFGCGGGGGGGGNPAPAHTPIIEDVEIYYWDHYYGDYFATNELALGDEWYYDVTVIDTGLDAKKVTCTQYYPIDSEIPGGSLTLMLESQSEVRTLYYVVDDYYVQYDSPLGNTRLDFQVEDGEGNISAVYSMFVKVTW